MSLLLSRRDIDFLLYDWLDVEALTSRRRFAAHSRSTFDPIIDLSAQIAEREFASHLKASDASEPTFDGGAVTLIPEIKAALDTFNATGLVGATLDEELGGMQLPAVVASACWAWFAAANVATTAYPFLTSANAHLLATYGSADQIDRFVRPMIDGRFFGTMCLSEPHAGSSLVDISTRAVPAANGCYRLTGTKMWISGGDHGLAENIVHLVLAKIPGGPPGVKGLSLFIVPKFLVDPDGVIGERNDVALAGLNHKMGFRGAVNTVLSFGDGVHRPLGEPGAVGYLVGVPHRGLEYMFHMMNEARIGVGMMAASIGYTGYLKALDYAQARTQGRALAVKDPASPPVPIIEHVDVRRMLLAQKCYAEGGLALNLYAARLLDEKTTAPDDAARHRAGVLLEILTPIAKSWPSQFCLEANSLAIQVLGGAGYTRDFDVEQHYRDNRLNMIHEGTHGLQALDLLARKVRMNDGEGLHALESTIRDCVTRAGDVGGLAAALAARLRESLDLLLSATAAAWTEDDPDTALANASLYLEGVGSVVVAWIWLEQVIACGEAGAAFHAGKRQAARYFFAYELPAADTKLALVRSRERAALDMRADWF